MRMPMMRHRRRMVLLMALPSHHHRQSIHNGHHNTLIGAATTLRRVPPSSLLISHRSREYRTAIVCRLPRIGLVVGRARRWCMALRPLQQSHHMRFESIRLADRWRRRLVFVLVGLGVRMVALHRDGVPHAWRDDV